MFDLGHISIMLHTIVYFPTVSKISAFSLHTQNWEVFPSQKVRKLLWGALLASNPSERGCVGEGINYLITDSY